MYNIYTYIIYIYIYTYTYIYIYIYIYNTTCSSSYHHNDFMATGPLGHIHVTLLKKFWNSCLDDQSMFFHLKSKRNKNRTNTKYKYKQAHFTNICPCRGLNTLTWLLSQKIQLCTVLIVSFMVSINCAGRKTASWSKIAWFSFFC